MEASNSSVGTLIFGSFFFIVFCQSFFSCPFSLFFCLAFYCLFSFCRIGFFIVLRFSPSFSTLFYSYFVVVVVTFIARFMSIYSSGMPPLDNTVETFVIESC
jgi:hypothetical protein